MPLAMVFGWIFYDVIELISWVLPYLIFTMLLITFCKVRPADIKVTSLSWKLIAVQLLGSLLLYLIIRPFNEDLAIGAFICMFCPTASSAPVVTGMLGGSVSKVAAFSIISNLSVALLAPILFAQMGPTDMELSIGATMGQIAIKVMPLIILPLPIAFLLEWKFPSIHKSIATHQSLSFYIWAFALFIVVGKAVGFVVSEPSAKVMEMVILTAIAGAVCILQFIVGRKIGAPEGNAIAGAQSLGQKNTIIALWMAMTFFNPITSIAPAAYIVWQNTINSGQIFFKSKRDLKEKKGSHC